VARKLTNSDERRVKIIRRLLDKNGGEMDIAALAVECNKLYSKASKEGWVAFIKESACQQYGGYAAGGDTAIVIGPGEIGIPLVTQTTISDMSEEVQAEVAAASTTHTLESSENGVRVYIPNGEDHIPKGVPDVIMTRSTQVMVDTLDIGLMSGSNIAFEGPKGTAKTQTVLWWAQKKGVPVIIVDCSEGTKERHLEGTWAETDSGIVFVAGPVIQAFELANKFGYCILVFEEINALNPHVQKRLNSLLDWRRSWYIPQLSRTWRLNPGAKLLCVANMNPTDHGGTHDLNEDFKSRWSIWNVGYPTKAEELNILEGVLGEVPEVVEWFPKFVTLADETRHGRSKGWTYALSTRDVIKMLRNFAYGMKLKGERRALDLAQREFSACFSDDKQKRMAKLRFGDIMGDETIAGVNMDEDDEEDDY
jgi:MoxR-like ATPase